MKKKILLALLMVVLLSTSVHAADVHLFIDGQEQDAEVILKDDRTFVPLRFISENLGYKVDYFHETRGIKISDDNLVIEMKVDSADFIKNGQKSQMDVKTFLKNDRTYVPIRFIAEAFSKEVGWDQESMSAYVGQKPEKFPVASKAPSTYSEKAYPEYGFKLFLPKGFEEKILIKPGKNQEGVEFYSKLVEEKQKGVGYLGSIHLASGGNIDYSLEEVLYFSENSSSIIYGKAGDFIASSGPLYDDMMACYKILDKVIVLPMANKYPEMKNTKVEFVGNDLVCTFVDTGVKVSLNEKYLDKVKVKVENNNISFYDLSNLNTGGGFLRNIFQWKEKSNEASNIAKVGNQYLGSAEPRDIQYGENGQKSYNDCLEIVLRQVKVKTPSGEKTLGQWINR